jgi:hypothetical protein
VRALRRALADDKEEAAEYLAGLADRCAAATDLETQVADIESIPDGIIEGLEPGTLVCMSSHGAAASPGRSWAASPKHCCAPSTAPP